MARLSKTQRTFLLVVLVIATLFFLWVLHDFALPIFWAIVFALVLHPYYAFLHRHIKSGSLSAVIVLVSALVVIILPTTLIGIQVVRETSTLYQSAITSNPFAQTTPFLTWLHRFGVDPQSIIDSITLSTQQIGTVVISKAFLVGAKAVTIFAKTFLMLYLFYFFLRDGEKIVDYIASRLPFGSSRDRFFSRFVSITRATIKGTIVVAVLEGLVGGLILAAVHAPNAVLWGALMTILSIIPILGPFLVWLPYGVWFILHGALWPGIIVIFGSAITMGIIDNVLRPALVKRDTKLPDALILVSIIGGVAVFGLAGVVIGPIAAALALTSWDIFAETYNHLHDSEVTL